MSVPSPGRTLFFFLVMRAVEVAEGGFGNTAGGDRLELGPNAVGELTAEDWLRQKIADPQAHPFGARVEIVTRGNHDDGNLSGLGMLFERAANLEAIHFRHHQVEQDHIDPMLANQTQTFDARDRLDGGEAFALEM